MRFDVRNSFTEKCENCTTAVSPDIDELDQARARGQNCVFGVFGPPTRASSLGSGILSFIEVECEEFRELFHAKRARSHRNTLEKTVRICPIVFVDVQ